MTSHPFSKYSGCGNDFILIDNRKGEFSARDAPLFSRLCHHQQSIGADGVILFENAPNGHFQMRIFNADGTEAEMCGNGLRCLVQFLRELEVEQEEYQIQTMHRCHRVYMDGDTIKAEMGPPSHFRWNLDLFGLPFHHLDTGVPHAITFVENLEMDSFLELARKVRHHPLFAPRGANVNIAKLSVDGSVHLRTYERGVEGETLACGTGAAAVALAAAKLFQLPSPIRVHPRSQKPLEISFTQSDDAFRDVYLSGPAKLLTKGKISIERNSPI